MWEIITYSLAAIFAPIIIVILLCESGDGGKLLFIVIVVTTIIAIIISPFFVIVGNGQLGSLNYHQLNPGIHLKSPFSEAHVFNPNQVLGYNNVKESWALNSGKLFNHTFYTTSSDGYTVVCNANGFDFTIDPYTYITVYNANLTALNHQIDLDLQSHIAPLTIQHTALENVAAEVSQPKDYKKQLTDDTTTWFIQTHKHLHITDDSYAPVRVHTNVHDEHVQDVISRMQIPGLYETYATPIDMNIPSKSSTSHYLDATTEIKESQELTSQIKPTQYSYKTTADIDKYIYETYIKDKPVEPPKSVTFYIQNETSEHKITTTTDSPEYDKYFGPDVYNSLNYNKR